MGSGSVTVCVTEKEALVRAKGRMTFVEAHPLRTFCLGMMEQGITRYILNARECTSMDSTFIGVLAMVALKGRGMGARVEICEAHEQVQGQILGLGLKRIFLFHNRCEDEHDSVDELATQGDSNAVRQTLLEAHETLAAANAGNRERFKDVLAYLRESSAS